jgi:prolyl 4-hydroxylase
MRFLKILRILEVFLITSTSLLLQEPKCDASLIVHAQEEMEEDLGSPVCNVRVDQEAACTSESTSSASTSSSVQPHAEQQQVHNYTAHDDVSWAIKSTTLRHEYHQEQYDRFLKNCRIASPYCKSQEDLRLYMNHHQPPSVYNYTTTGFAIMPAPGDVWNLLNDFYQRNKGQQVIEYPTKVTPYHNSWDQPTHILRLDNTSLEGGGSDLQDRISRAIQPVLEQWTQQRLVPVSVYGIRIYNNQSILAPHVDRMPLVTSCIINLDQHVDNNDEPWPLEVFDHQGKAHNVSMSPGDLVLYESHSVIHGRPFPLRGSFFANAFLHFEPIGPLLLTMENNHPADSNDNNNNNNNNNENSSTPSTRKYGVPPYIIPGSPWEQEWHHDNPNGWALLHSAEKAVKRGDHRTLELIARINPAGLSEIDDNGWAPIHQAVRYGQLKMVQFLLDHGVSPNQPLKQPQQPQQVLIPLELALHLLGADHEVTKFLWTVTKL